MTPAGTSNELDVQNGWEENTKHTHTLDCEIEGTQVLIKGAGKHHLTSQALILEFQGPNYIVSTIYFTTKYKHGSKKVYFVTRYMFFF